MTMVKKAKIDHDTPIRSALTSSIKWNWCKASSGLPSSCSDEKLTICRAKNWVNKQCGQKMTRRFFDDATVETAMRSSIDYKYTTINNFDETIDDSLATLDNNIVIMTIKTTTVSLRSTAQR
jgi:hypothetical protein